MHCFVRQANNAVELKLNWKWREKSAQLSGGGGGREDRAVFWTLLAVENLWAGESSGMQTEVSHTTQNI